MFSCPVYDPLSLDIQHNMIHIGHHKNNFDITAAYYNVLIVQSFSVYMVNFLFQQFHTNYHFSSSSTRLTAQVIFPVTNFSLLSSNGCCCFNRWEFTFKTRQLYLIYLQFHSYMQKLIQYQARLTGPLCTNREKCLSVYTSHWLDHASNTVLLRGWRITKKTRN